MNNADNKYDFVSDFNQGVAIVVKNGLYGVILVGGKEIIKPIYDYISDFKDGYAQVIRKGENLTLDLSGQEYKRYQGKLIAIPSKYDTVRDFNNGYACVQLNGKWGAIDINCKEIYAPQFCFLSDFIGGTAKYKMQQANYWGFVNTDGYCSECNLKEPEIESDGNLIIERNELTTNTKGSVYVNIIGNILKRRVRINNKGQLLVNNGEDLVALPDRFFIARDFENGLAIVQDYTGYWGAIDVNGKILIALQFAYIKSFSEDRAFAINKGGKLCLISTNGTIVKEFDTYSDGNSFKDGYAVVAARGKYGLINYNGEEILSPQDGYIHNTKISQEFEISSYSGDKHGLFLASTGLLIKPKFKKIIEIKKDCIKVEVDEFGENLIDLSGRVFIEKDGTKVAFPEWCIGVKPLIDNIYLGIADNGKKGLLDSIGETLCKPQFDNVGEFDNDIIPLYTKETNGEDKIITKYGLYNVKSKLFIPIKYDICPKFSNGFYKITLKGALGIINSEGVIVLKPVWKQIHLSNGYFVVSEIEKDIYLDLEVFGLTDLDGNFILETKYEAISVFRDGLYKVKENNLWSIYNDDGRLTNESYDEIKMDGDYFIVSKNRLSGRLNEHGEKVIKSEDGTYLILPSKFAWGYDFKDGIAKVFINGYKNYVDKSFNIVIAAENKIIPVDKSIEYLITKDSNGNYIFASDNKFGIINYFGEILIQPKYQCLFHFVDNSYIAGILKDHGYYVYGIIDIDDKTVVPFEYSLITPFKGTVQHDCWSWDDEYMTEEVSNPENIEHWLVRKKGYGLIDRDGNPCIQPIYEDIQKIGKCFLVKENNKYGLISSDYTLVAKYSTVSSIGNGLYKVSIDTSQCYNHKSEVFGILDSDGNERLEPIYQFIGNVNDDRVAKGRAIINLKGLLGLVDENYSILAEPQYEHISDFKNSKATVTKRIFNHDTSRVTLIRGEIDINGIFTDIAESTKSDIIDKTKSGIKIVKTLTNGFVVIQKNDPSPIYQYCAVLDKVNNIVLPYKYHKIEEQKNGMFIVYFRNGREGFYGLLNQEFQEVVAPKYVYIQIIQDVFVVRNGDRGTSTTGLINSKGETLLPCIYSSVTLADSNLVWISKDNGKLIGLASIDGKVLLEPTYGKVGTFKNGYATVNDGHWYDVDEDKEFYPPRSSKEFSMGKWGVINANGQLILSTIYDSINIEDDSYFTVSRYILIKQDNGQSTCKRVSGRYNIDGKLIIKNIHGEYVLASNKYDWQGDFDTEGKSLVYYKGHIGIVNQNFQQIVSCNIEGKTFKITLPEAYDWGYDSVSPYVIIEKNSSKGVIDCNKNLIINPIYNQVIALNDSKNTVFKCGQLNETKSCYLWSIINVEGNIVIDIKSEDIIHMGFSFLGIKTDKNKYLIVDFNGQTILDLLFDTVFNFGVSSSSSKGFWLEGLNTVNESNYAIVSIDGKYGIIDNQGKLIIYPKYSYLAILNKNKILADGIFINSFEQNIVVKDNLGSLPSEEYDNMDRLDNGILIVSKNDLFGCINQIGSVIIPLKYKSLIYQNNLLIAVCYDETATSDKRGVINFQNRPIVPFSQHIEDIKIDRELILYRQNGHWGAYSLHGEIICEPLFDHIIYIADNLIKVGMDGKENEFYNDYYWEDGERFNYTNYRECSVINWGLIDNNGNKILSLEYRSIADKVVDGLVQICSNKRLGFVDITGRILLEPTYHSIGEFIDGYAVVSKASYDFDAKGRDRERIVFGVINSQFKEIIPCVFDSIMYEKESACFKTDVGYKTLDGRYIADIEGKEFLLDKKYKYCKPFNDTCAIAVQVSDGHVKYGLVDQKSNDILPPVYSSLDYIENDLYKFKLNDKYGLVNSKGNIILQNVYSVIGNFEDNLACVCMEKNEFPDERYGNQKVYGYVDSLGNVILPPIYDFIGKRTNKFSVVMKNNTWGLFSIENRQLKIFPNVDFLGPCMDDLCNMNVGGKFDKNNKKISGGLWGFVSVHGKIVIEPIYEQVYRFSDGMAAVKLNGMWGFINTEGIIVVPCEYDKVESSYKKGKGKLIKDYEVFVFDKSGNLLESYEQDYGDNDYDYGSYDDDEPTYRKYGGYNGYSDQTIDEVFGGDPSLTWNCN